MRVINSSSDLLAYQEIFGRSHQLHTEMLLWQALSETERKTSAAYIDAFHPDVRELHFDLPSGGPLESALPLYCYSQEGLFIFKTQIQDLQEHGVSVALPEEIKILEEDEITRLRDQLGIDLSPWRREGPNTPSEENDFLKVMPMDQRTGRDRKFLTEEWEGLTLDEEDQLFADKRETPRARPKEEKWVKLKVRGNPAVHLMRLFDLSQGGLGFLTKEAYFFPKGSEIQIVGFADFDLDDPLVGVVQSHRPLDDSKMEHKIGVKFKEGQS